MTDKPTPKEIDDLVYELRQAGKDDTYSLASAVLAKWGQPAPASQPVAVPAQAGEPWYGHKFKEQHRGIWRCECGKTVKETTADWLDMSADELRNLRTETAALCADYDAARVCGWEVPRKD